MRAVVVFLSLTAVLFVSRVDATHSPPDAYDDDYGSDEYAEDPNPKYYSYYMPMPAAYGANPAAYAGGAAGYYAPGYGAKAYGGGGYPYPY